VTTAAPIPPDFPQAALTGAVPGAQPKLLARKEGGTFVADSAEPELRARYDACEDLAHQLVSYRVRKLTQNPQWSNAQLADKITRSVRQRAFGWGLSPAETEWVLRRVAALAEGSNEGHS
jgi:hypothetical protein